MHFRHCGHSTDLCSHVNLYLLWYEQYSYPSQNHLSTAWRGVKYSWFACIQSHCIWYRWYCDDAFSSLYCRHSTDLCWHVSHYLLWQEINTHILHRIILLRYIKAWKVLGLHGLNRIEMLEMMKGWWIFCCTVDTVLTCVGTWVFISCDTRWILISYSASLVYGLWQHGMQLICIDSIALTWYRWWKMMDICHCTVVATVLTFVGL